MTAQILFNDKGEKGVFVPFKAYKKILKDLEDLENIRLYDKAKKECRGDTEDAEKVFERLLKIKE